MHQVISHRTVENGWRCKFLAGDGGSNNGKDAGADYSPDPQTSKRPGPQRLFQPLFRIFRFRNQLVDRLAREELVRQVNTPGS
jgi:hypothetical protein